MQITFDVHYFVLAYRLTTIMMTKLHLTDGVSPFLSTHHSHRPSVFHFRIKTHLFHKSCRLSSHLQDCRIPWTVTRTGSGVLIGFCFFYFFVVLSSVCSSMRWIKLAPSAFQLKLNSCITEYCVTIRYTVSQRRPTFWLQHVSTNIDNYYC